jgi:ribosomal protein L37AE/L43A
VTAYQDYARKAVRLLKMIEKRRHEGLTCPQCGKMVGLFDMVCRFCMYWFEDGKQK